MLELVLIFAVALLVIPLVDLTLGETGRVIKAVIIAVTLIVLAFLLFFSGYSFPHSIR
jgi:hypothetical protein